MGAAGTDFSVFTTPAHTEIMEQAVREILAGDPEIAAFTDNVFWLPDPFAVPDRTLPFIVITSPTWDLVHELSGEVENTIRIGITCAYDERRGHLDPEERTVKAWQARVDIVLSGNRGLENTAIGTTILGDGRALADTYGGLETVRFAALRFSEGEIFTALELLARYDFATTALTGVVVT